MEILYGFLGALLAMALAAMGAVCGWLACRAVVRHTKPRLEQPGQQERQRLMEEQQAFRQLQNYSTERAYGLTGGENG